MNVSVYAIFNIVNMKLFIIVLPVLVCLQDTSDDIGLQVKFSVNVDLHCKLLPAVSCSFTFRGIALGYSTKWDQKQSLLPLVHCCFWFIVALVHCCFWFIVALVHCCFWFIVAFGSLLL